MDWRRVASLNGSLICISANQFALRKPPLPYSFACHPLSRHVIYVRRLKNGFLHFFARRLWPAVTRIGWKLQNSALLCLYMCCTLQPPVLPLLCCEVKSTAPKWMECDSEWGLYSAARQWPGKDPANNKEHNIYFYRLSWGWDWIKSRT